MYTINYKIQYKVITLPHLHENKIACDTNACVSTIYIYIYIYHLLLPPIKKYKRYIAECIKLKNVPLTMIESTPLSSIQIEKKKETINDIVISDGLTNTYSCVYFLN